MSGLLPALVPPAEFILPTGGNQWYTRPTRCPSYAPTYFLVDPKDVCDSRNLQSGDLMIAPDLIDGTQTNQHPYTWFRAPVRGCPDQRDPLGRVHAYNQAQPCHSVQWIWHQGRLMIQATIVPCPWDAAYLPPKPGLFPPAGRNPVNWDPSL